MIEFGRVLRPLSLTVKNAEKSRKVRRYRAMRDFFDCLDAGGKKQRMYTKKSAAPLGEQDLLSISSCYTVFPPHPSAQVAPQRCLILSVCDYGISHLFLLSLLLKQLTRASARRHETLNRWLPFASGSESKNLSQNYF